MVYRGSIGDAERFWRGFGGVDRGRTKNLKGAGSGHSWRERSMRLIGKSLDAAEVPSHKI